MFIAIYKVHLRACRSHRRLEGQCPAVGGTEANRFAGTDTQKREEKNKKIIILKNVVSDEQIVNRKVQTDIS